MSKHKNIEPANPELGSLGEKAMKIATLGLGAILLTGAGLAAKTYYDLSHMELRPLNNLLETHVHSEAPFTAQYSATEQHVAAQGDLATAVPHIAI